MRSLPPPRITRKRRWRRIKRAVKSFFTKGYVSDPGAFLINHNNENHSISKIKQSRVSSRVRKTRSKPLDLGIRESANVGIKTAGFVSKIARRASAPIFRPVSKSLLNLSVKF